MRLPSDRNVVLTLLGTAAFLAAFGWLSCRVASAVPAHLPDPVVVSDTGHRRDTDYVRLLVVKNPRRSAVNVDLWCRKDPRSMTRATVPARGQVTFEMTSDQPLNVGDCELANWR